MLLPNKDQTKKNIGRRKNHGFELITPDSFLSYITNHARWCHLNFEVRGKIPRVICDKSN